LREGKNTEEFHHNVFEETALREAFVYYKAEVCITLSLHLHKEH